MVRARADRDALGVAARGENPRAEDRGGQSIVSLALGDDGLRRHAAFDQQGPHDLAFGRWKAAQAPGDQEPRMGPAPSQAIAALHAIPQNGARLPVGPHRGAEYDEIVKAFAQGRFHHTSTGAPSPQSARACRRPSPPGSKASIEEPQIIGRAPAAIVLDQLVFDLLALVEARQPGALDRRYVNECVL